MLDSQAQKLDKEERPEVRFLNTFLIDLRGVISNSEVGMVGLFQLRWLVNTDGQCDRVRFYIGCEALTILPARKKSNYGTRILSSFHGHLLHVSYFPRFCKFHCSLYQPLSCLRAYSSWSRQVSIKIELDYALVSQFLILRSVITNACRPPQILASIPDIHGKSVIELGAGIGRFTGELAKIAGDVLACDFMENAVEKVKILPFTFVYTNHGRVEQLISCNEI